MNEHDDERETQINALLDGELNSAGADELKSAASDDRELARTIIEAYELQQVMDGIHVERAPAGLTKRLRSIPREQRAVSAGRWIQPRWAIALATIPLVIIALSVMWPDRPSTSEIVKARQQLALAFAYLDRAGAITRREIELTVGQATANAVTGSVNRAIQLQKETTKEKKA